MTQTLWDKGLENYNFILNKKIWELYVRSTDKFLLCQDGRIWMPHRRLTMKQIKYHLRGTYNVAVFASERSTKFICFDIDYNDKAVVLRLIDVLVELGFDRSKIYPSISGGKGYHVEIFFDEYVANAAAEKLYRAVIERGGFDERKVEFRPTSTQAVRLPLSRHYKTGVMGWYCNVDTLEPIETTMYVFEIERVPRDLVTQIAGGVKVSRRKAARASAVAPDCEPDRSKMPVITAKNTRHQLMTDIATWMRMQGYGADQIYAELMAWVAEQDQSLITSTAEEVEEDARLIAAWAENKIKPKPGGGMRDVRFTADDLNYILNGRTKTERRILFRGVLAEKVFGSNRASQRLIASSLGVSRQTVAASLRGLEERG